MPLKRPRQCHISSGLKARVDRAAAEAVLVAAGAVVAVVTLAVVADSLTSSSRVRITGINKRMLAAEQD